MQVFELASDGLSTKTAYRRLNHLRRVTRMRNVILASSAAAHDAQGHRHRRPVMVTLTYRADANYSPKQINQYTRNVKRRIERKTGARCCYQWVMELTKAGKPHYHVLWWLPPKIRLKKADECGDWPHGYSRTERAKHGPKYISKYVSKGSASYELYQLPKNARMFYVTGTPDASHKARAPAWLRDTLTEPGDRLTRITRLGWVHKQTGELFETPFELRVIRTDAQQVLLQVHKRETTQC